MRDLTDFEIEILEECAGLRPARAWDAVVGAAFESLRKRRYVTGAGHVTGAGWVFLNNRVFAAAQEPKP